MNPRQETLKDAMTVYSQVRSADDIDLITEVRNVLCNSGLAGRLPDAFDNHPYITEGKNKPSNVQRYLLNRYWNAQLMIYAHISSDQRYCLIPNGTVQQWLDLFQKTVMPFIIQNNLPVRIQ